ncbi:GAF domain-containing sensor histidine kinase [Thermoleptolyngbya sp. M55_K2018_002]|uniref:GAF domain-containing sensor histidine kinase n=1 Tax=Thermoleptolyngbya sp. M55_K2018_002 TaxID=2747808 RepID=UPI001A0A707C|nr:GAF domain-containing sensor histidine kinase [Thermoleptolyngbya sp. M55_K2018_002]HIK42297.1 GAF domain-containing sensor histidine kinase [Thermoleptolyngbya sp. M55_K2018_002]
MLQKRDRLLEATAKAANVLLTLNNFDEAVNMALQVLGEGIDCDFVIVLENVFESSTFLPSFCDFIYEWTSPGILPISVTFGSKRLPSELLGLEFLEQYFLEGSGFGGLLEEWSDPMRSVLASVNIQSAYAVPIRVKGQWWGALCLDYCRAPIQISAAEISVLMTIADCIGSAIQRDRLQQERQQAAQQRTADLEAYNQVLQGRDRLLEAAAKATNVLLTVESLDEALNSALKIIGEGMGCDRFHIIENISEPSSTLPIRFSYIYEWSRPEFTRSLAQLDSAAIQADQLEAAFIEQYFLNGNGFGGLLEVWPESLRNSPTADQVQSAYAVPIRVNGQWWGVLAFHYCREAIQVSPAVVSVLMTLADCIGSAIQRDRTQKLILQAEQNRVLELAKANDAMRRNINWLARDPNMNTFLGHLLQELAMQFDTQNAQIVLYNPHEQTLQTLVSLINNEIALSPPYTTETPAQMWLGWEILLRSSKPIPFSTDTEPHLFLPGCLEFYRQQNKQGIVCTLLKQDEQPLGFIEFSYHNRETFSESELELVQSLAQQATLAIQLTRLAEEAQQLALLQERTRMAREIHDTLAQAFGGILMQLQAATHFATTQSEKAQNHLLTAQALAREGLAEARRSVWTLYLETAEYEDLAKAIAKFIEQTPSDQSTSIDLAIDGTPYRLHPDLGLNLLRIAQESITNALRHANAQTIQVNLRYHLQTLQLSIHDDGCGFEPQSPTRGFGLLGMQQRAARIGATWHLVSQAGHGTTVTVSIADPMLP